MDDPFEHIPSQSAKLRRDLKAIIYPELELPMICPGFVWVPGGPPRRRESLVGSEQLTLEVGGTGE